MLPPTIRQYYEIYEGLDRPCLYSAPWWLDAVCGPGGWGAVTLSDTEHKLHAALPYHSTRIKGLTAVITPPLTQWVSVIAIKDAPSGIYPAFFSALPKSSILQLALKPDTDLMEDASFPLQMKYSYILPPSGDMERVRAGYNEGLKRNLRQAEKNYSILESEDMEGFLSLCMNSYQQQSRRPPSWLQQVVPGVYSELMKHQSGKLLMSSVQGKSIAGALIAWDHESVYYLAGGRTSDDHGASAHALLLDYAIREATATGKAFDFEGSMHPGIANFFQSFGAVPSPYWEIRKFSGLGKLWGLFR